MHLDQLLVNQHPSQKLPHEDKINRLFNEERWKLLTVEYFIHCPSHQFAFFGLTGQQVHLLVPTNPHWFRLHFCHHFDVQVGSALLYWLIMVGDYLLARVCNQASNLCLFHDIGYTAQLETSSYQELWFSWFMINTVLFLKATSFV